MSHSRHTHPTEDFEEYTKTLEKQWEESWNHADQEQKQSIEAEVYAHFSLERYLSTDEKAQLEDLQRHTQFIPMINWRESGAAIAVGALLVAINMLGRLTKVQQFLKNSKDSLKKAKIFVQSVENKSVYADIAANLPNMGSANPLSEAIETMDHWVNYVITLLKEESLALSPQEADNLSDKYSPWIVEIVKNLLRNAIKVQQNPDTESESSNTYNDLSVILLGIWSEYRKTSGIVDSPKAQNRTLKNSHSHRLLKNIDLPLVPSDIPDFIAKFLGILPGTAKYHQYHILVNISNMAVSAIIPNITSKLKMLVSSGKIVYHIYQAIKFDNQNTRAMLQESRILHTAAWRSIAHAEQVLEDSRQKRQEFEKKSAEQSWASHFIATDVATEEARTSTSKKPNIYEKIILEAKKEDDFLDNF